MSINHFCALLKISRSTLYYKPRGESEENLEIMRLMDEHYMEHPTAGVRTMAAMLPMYGIHANVKRVRRLMRLMDLSAIYPQRSLSKNNGRAVYKAPYLLRGLEITHPNHVWSTDISYIPMEHGFMYMYAIIDVYSRCIVGWSLENTLTADNCVRLLDKCIKQHGKPKIINTDQGSQYTGVSWQTFVERCGVMSSMDGRGRCKDNIWIERFWRTLKQEYVYTHPTNEVANMRQGIAQFIEYYNNERPHQGLNYQIPMKVYKIRA